MSTFSCPNCGTLVSEGAAFCDSCGISLAAGAFPLLCPNCRAEVQSHDLYCDNCGYSLRDPRPPMIEEPAAMDADSEEEPAEIEQPAPRLLVLPAGTALMLDPDKDRHVIGRIDPASGSFPDIDLVPFGGEEGGVSRRHAQIARTEQGFVIEDLNSVNYTFVNRQKVAPGTPHPLRDGDEIRLGRVVLQFKTS